MLLGLHQRIAVGLALMGVLLLSVGACVLPAQAATQACCMQMSMPCAPSAHSCCAAGPEVPAAVVQPAVRGVAVTAVVHWSLPVGAGTVSRDGAMAAVVPTQASPPGNFILRI
ncbi:MAG TPA: hypothetical protein VGN01_06320 [Acidobacteriaceae bacterium]|jgi:hypothetical protein